MPSGLRVLLPAKITCSSFCERRLREDCSPSTQRIASTRLDLPEPLGPTTAVVPSTKSSVVASANVLKPKTLRDLRRMELEGRSGFARGTGTAALVQRDHPAVVLRRGCGLRLRIAPPQRGQRHR